MDFSQTKHQRKWNPEPKSSEPAEIHGPSLILIFSFANGITLNGEKFAFLRVEGDQLLGKGKSEAKAPLCVHKTNQALVIAVGTQTAQAGQLNMAVGRLGEYLSSQNY